MYIVLENMVWYNGVTQYNECMIFIFNIMNVQYNEYVSYKEGTIKAIVFWNGLATA